MHIVELSERNIDSAVPLVAAFRASLELYKGVIPHPDLDACRRELLEYVESGFPVYVAETGGNLIGYLVCRVDKPTVWVESIYVLDEYRRNGVASLLFKNAEALAKSYGEDMVFNYVHPNNNGMIAFLKKHGYTVLNLIEIRKPYKGEHLSRKIRVDDNLFDY
jgi:ribosomal protein S18 acetylase RimI-like enzyme